MGEVYLAEHRHLERQAAIKVLLPDLSRNDEVVARFFTEARAASRIHHPGIVEILDCDVHPSGRAFIVMEYLEGESLAACLARLGALEVPPAVSIVVQIAESLDAAHGLGIVHRDLKPDNVFLASTPRSDVRLRVKVLDFGIAKLAVEGQSLHKTRTGSLLGTPLYMSPEQCRGISSIDHRSDIYSLGCIAFELLSGQPPFVREAPGDLIAAHIGEPPPELAALADVPERLNATVMSMLEKDPERRPRSMAAVIEEFESVTPGAAPQLATMILPPDGNATATPGRAASEGPRPRTAPTKTERLSPDPTPAGGGRAGLRSGASAGGTRLLAETNTTLGRTASELSQPSVAQAAPTRASTKWLVSGIAAAFLAGVVVTAVLLRRDETQARMGTPVQVEPAATGPVRDEQPKTKDLRPPPPVEREVTVTSTPPGADLWVGDEPAARGRTPMTLRLNVAGGPVKARVSAAGHLDRMIDIDPRGASPVAVELEPQREKRTDRVSERRQGPRATKLPKPREAYPVLPDRSQAGGGTRDRTSYPKLPD